MSQWKPLLTGNSKKAAEIKLGEIAAILSLEVKNVDSINLMGGGGGLSLFLAYYGRYKGSNEHIDLCNDVLNKIIDLCNETDPYYPFAEGITGMCWTMQHLNDNNFIEANVNELFTDLDEILKDEIIYFIQESDFGYDFFHGALGMAFYLLKNNNKKCDEYIELFLNELKKKCNYNNALKTVKLKSKVSDRKLEVRSVYNFSLSHGMAGIINFLAKYIQKIENKEEHLQLLTGLINYFKNHEQDPNVYKSYFPNWLDETETPNSSRLAWCYGDLGIGLSLYRAANLLNDDNLKQYSLSVLKHTTTRINPEVEQVYDAGLCHGATGNAHIYHRLFNETGIEEFRNTAIYWHEVGLRMAKYKDGLAGYKYLAGANKLVNDTGFLNGIAGIGLSLISAISDIEPKWDECLLIS